MLLDVAFARYEESYDEESYDEAVYDVLRKSMAKLRVDVEDEGYMNYSWIKGQQKGDKIVGITDIPHASHRVCYYIIHCSFCCFMPINNANANLSMRTSSTDGPSSSTADIMNRQKRTAKNVLPKTYRQKRTAKNVPYLRDGAEGDLRWEIVRWIIWF